VGESNNFRRYFSS